MKYSVLLCALMFAASSWSQCTFSIQGKVIDQHDGSWIRDARITLKGEGKGTYSDSLGFYKIDQICAGAHVLQVSHHLGCEPLKLELVLTKDTLVDLQIEFHFLEIEDMEVNFYRFDRALENQQELKEEDRRASASQNLGNQLAKMPGVEVLSTGASVSKPVIRGLHSNRVLVWNNGVRQEGQQWGGEHGPEVDPFFYSDISVIKGPGSIRYGADAMGGVVRASLDTWQEKKGYFFHSQSGLTSNGQQGFQSVLLGNQSKRFPAFKWKIGGSSKIAGDQHTADYLLTNTGFRELNLLSFLIYEKGKNKWTFNYTQFNTELAVLKASHLGNLSDLQQAIKADRPLVEEPFSYAIQAPKQQINHHIARLSWKHQFSSKWDLEVDGSQQFNNRLEYDVHSKNGEADFQLNLTTYQGNVILSCKLNERNSIEMGTNGQYQENKRAGRFLVPNFKQTNAGSFVQWNRTTNKWTTVAGVRYDKIQQTAFTYLKDSLINKAKEFSGLSGNVGASRSFGHHWLVKEKFSYGWRMPNISELYSNGLHHGAAAIEVGNEQLTEEQMLAHQTSAAFKSRRFRAELDLYQYYFLNYIYLNPADQFVLSIKGAFPEFTYQQTEAFFNGLEAQISFDWTKWFIQNLNYTMVRAIDLQARNFLYGIPADRMASELICLLPFWEGKLRLNNIFVAKQNRVEMNADFADTPDGYYLLNLDFSAQLPTKKGAYFINLGVQNLTNSAYRSYLSRYRYFADNLGRNFTMTFTIKL